MSAKFITAILSAGALIATLASTTPVQAGDRDDFKKFLGAAVGLYILGQALDGKHKGANVATQGYAGQGFKGHVYGNGHKGNGRKSWTPPPLPRQCIRQIGGKHQQWNALGAHCLKRTYSAANALPSACRTSAWYRGSQHAFYTIGCLQNRGFQLARH